MSDWTKPIGWTLVIVPTALYVGGWVLILKDKYKVKAETFIGWIMCLSVAVGAWLVLR